MNQIDMKKNLIELILAFHLGVATLDELIHLFNCFSVNQNESFLLYLKDQYLIDNELLCIINHQLNELINGFDAKSKTKDLIVASSGLIQELSIRLNNIDLYGLNDFASEYFTTSIGSHSVSNKQSIYLTNININEIDHKQSLSDPSSQMFFETDADKHSINNSYSDNKITNPHDLHVEMKLNKDDSTQFQYETLFKKSELIAEGAIGSVFRANDSSFARTVALKQMHDRSVDRFKEQLHATFLLEGEVTARLDHPGVLPMYGLGRTGSGLPYYVMKFIDTPDFESLINKYHGIQSGNTTASTITAEQLRKLLSHFLAACQTLQYAHDRGVLHCDVKPANIMTGRYGETYVVDWGMAILFKAHIPISNSESYQFIDPIYPMLDNSRSALHRDQGGTRSFIGGTLGYMAPEHYQANQENCIKEMTPACDIFSMGAVLYQIITGVMPVNAVADETTAERVLRIRKGEYVPVSFVKSGVSKSLDAICQKAMNPDRSLRYKRISDLADDVEKWLAGEPVSARRESVIERCYRWANRNRTSVFLGFGGLVLILFTSMVIIFIEQKNRVQMEESDVELVFEQQLALKNERNAIAQRKRVEEREALRIKSEKLLVATINRFIDDVSNNPDLKNNPDLEDLRNDLLRAPMEYLTQFEVELNSIPDTSPESIALVANGFAQLGELTSRIGKKAESLTAFEKSVATFEKVLTLQKNNDDFQNGLARTLQLKAETHRIMGNFNLAEPNIEKAYTIINKLLEKNVDNFNYLNDQADIEDHLGVIYRATQRADKARQLFEKALKTREKLVKAEPMNQKFQLDLAASYRILGISLQDLGDYQGASKCYTQYLQLIIKVANNQPENWSIRRKIVDAYQTIGILEENLERPELARGYYKKCRSILEQRLKANPVDPDSESTLAFQLMLLASLDEEHSPEIAEDNYLLSVKMLRNLVKRFPSVSSYRGNLAASLKGAGVCNLNRNKINEARFLLQEALKVQQDLHDQHPEASDTEAGIADIMEKLSMTEKSSELAFQMLLNAIELQKKSLLKNPGFQMFQTFLIDHWNVILSRVNETINPSKNYLLLTEMLSDMESVFPKGEKFHEIQQKLSIQHAMFLVRPPGNEVAAYQLGLSIANKLNAEKDSESIQVLAIAKYRNGFYNEASELLKKRISNSQDSKRPIDLLDQAFYAMSLFRSGNKSQAHEILQKLDDLTKINRFSKDQDNLEFVGEAMRWINPLVIPEELFQK